MPAQFNDSKLNGFLTQLRDAWQARAPRERQWLAAAAGVLLLAAVYAGIYDPAAQGIAKLKQSLPKTQMVATQAEQLADQITVQAASQTTVQTQSASTAAINYTSAAGINASLQAVGIAPAQATTAAAAPFTVTVQSAAGDQIWAWLRTAPIGTASFKRSVSGAWQGTATPAP